MQARNDIYTWPIALVFGSFITLALFFTLPALRFRHPNPEPPVIEIDFMQWREPAPVPKTKSLSPPKPVVKPKPRPVVNVQPKPPSKPKPAEIIPREPVIPEKPTAEDPPAVTPPAVAPQPIAQPSPVDDAKPAQHLEQDMPAPVPIFKLTSMPRFAHKVEPQYPLSMRALGRESRVKLEVLIDHKGKVRRVTILQSGGEAFDTAARSALLASSFIPGNIEGKSVAVLMRIPIVFRLK